MSVPNQVDLERHHHHLPSILHPEPTTRDNKLPEKDSFIGSQKQHHKRGLNQLNGLVNVHTFHCLNLKEAAANIITKFNYSSSFLMRQHLEFQLTSLTMSLEIVHRYFKGINVFSHLQIREGRYDNCHAPTPAASERASVLVYIKYSLS